MNNFSKFAPLRMKSQTWVPAPHTILIHLFLYFLFLQIITLFFSTNKNLKLSVLFKLLKMANMQELDIEKNFEENKILKFWYL